eukprot:c17493_g1_i1.p1 GENE.c17493_g1_i1~~c17493_g1_i1.p1  ORF type:complete len:348 (+),score=147.38 c17493_g1_i1:49-1044(+)
MVFVSAEIDGTFKCFEIETDSINVSCKDIKQRVCDLFLIPVSEQYVCIGSKCFSDTDILNNESLSMIFSINTRVLGGKGGFGSLLKGGSTGYGFEKKKAVSLGACRDLNGRRVRNTENEKKLREWSSGLGSQRAKELNEIVENFGKKRNFQRRGNSQTSDALRELNSVVQHFGKPSNKKRGINDISASSSSSVPSSSRVPSQYNSNYQTDPDKDIQAVSSEVIEGVKEALAKKQKLNSSEEKQEEEQQKNQEEEQQKNEEEHKIQEEQLLNLDEIASAKDLEQFGNERLKVELQKRQLKFGGTLEQRAQRLFSVKGLTPEQIPRHLKTQTK